MNAMQKPNASYIIGLLWILYTLYLTTIERIYLFLDDYIEILVAMCIQIIIYIIMKLLFSKRYLETIQLSSITSCGLVILWHYSFFNNIISTGTILKLFLVSNIVLVTILYARNKIFNKGSKISILKNLGIVLISSFANIIGAIFTFYVIYYWIL